ncbi:MAG: UDP-glucose 4-epimerase GalE [Proteobacteria bacterium]|nr:UDP-glucose 4-epimerase GalE [Pseudomonadota bacterium]
MSRILVTGGAGYVGSFIVRALSQKGHEPVVFDNLEEGHRGAVPDAEFVHGDLADQEKVYQTLQHFGISAVIHMAAYCLVGESQQSPVKYFQNNISNGVNLLEAMLRKDLRVLVFSSSAAVYGEPSSIPIGEEAPTNPTNVYGETKLYYERVLKRCDGAYGLRSITLRYFNAAGADEHGAIGEDHRQETHLIPIILKTALGQRVNVEIFGTDYPTADGTCIRDYIHVEDLANAHILALEALENGSRSATYNLGNGKGYSVQDVVNMARQITGKEIPVAPTRRRRGDPAVLVASSDRIKRDLGWHIQHPTLEKIIQTAWAWHSSHPEGYGDSDR